MNANTTRRTYKITVCRDTHDGSELFAVATCYDRLEAERLIRERKDRRGTYYINNRRYNPDPNN